MTKYKIVLKEALLYTYEVEADNIDIAADEAFNKHLTGESSCEDPVELDLEVVEVKIV